MKQPIMDSLRFPGGKTRALTFSYDDGVLQDRRLVGILNDHGLRGTFNIGSGVLGYVDPTGLMTKRPACPTIRNCRPGTRLPPMGCITRRPQRWAARRPCLRSSKTAAGWRN